MANTTDNACNFLDSLQRFDLSMLLRSCRASIEQLENSLDWFSDLKDEAIFVRAAKPVAEALQSLPPQDRKRIAEAILSGKQVNKQHEDIRVETLDGLDANGTVALLSELLIHRAMMISVATGGSRIQEVDDYYQARKARIRRSLPEGTTYENPHADLWAWYHHWKRPHQRPPLCRSSLALKPKIRRHMWARSLFATSFAGPCFETGARANGTA